MKKINMSIDNNSQATADCLNLGVSGEHLETQLIISLAPDVYEHADYMRVFIDNYYSEKLYVNRHVVKYVLPASALRAGQVAIQLNAYKLNENGPIWVFRSVPLVFSVEPSIDWCDPIVNQAVEPLEVAIVKCGVNTAIAADAAESAHIAVSKLQDGIEIAQSAAAAAAAAKNGCLDTAELIAGAAEEYDKILKSAQNQVSFAVSAATDATTAASIINSQMEVITDSHAATVAAKVESQRAADKAESSAKKAEMQASLAVTSKNAADSAKISAQTSAASAQGFSTSAANSANSSAKVLDDLQQMDILLKDEAISTFSTAIKKGMTGSSVSTSMAAADTFYNITLLGATTEIGASMRSPSNSYNLVGSAPTKITAGGIQKRLPELNPLLSVPSGDNSDIVRDTFNTTTAKLIRRTRKIVLDSSIPSVGSEYLIYLADQGRFVYRCATIDAEIKYGAQQFFNCICSHLTTKSSFAAPCVFKNISDPCVYFDFGDPAINTRESLNKWLDKQKAIGKPVTMIYEIAHPVETMVDEGKVLVPTADAVSVDKGEMTVSWILDTKEYVDSKQPVLTSYVIDYEPWKTQPTVAIPESDVREGETEAAAFDSNFGVSYRATLKNIDGSDLPKGNFKITDNINGWASAYSTVYQIPSAIAISENSVLEIKNIDGIRKFCSTSPYFLISAADNKHFEIAINARFNFCITNSTLKIMDGDSTKKRSYCATGAYYDRKEIQQQYHPANILNICPSAAAEKRFGIGSIDISFDIKRNMLIGTGSATVRASTSKGMDANAVITQTGGQTFWIERTDNLPFYKGAAKKIGIYASNADYQTVFLSGTQIIIKEWDI